MKNIYLVVLFLSLNANAINKLSKVITNKGNIHLLCDLNYYHKITNLGLDTLPKLSKDKKSVFFIRNHSKQNHYLTQIVRYDIFTDKEKVLVNALEDNPKLSTPISYANTEEYYFPSLGSLINFELSTDNSRIYFETTAWTVSSAVHYYDLNTGKISLFNSGSLIKVFENGTVELEITGNEGNGRYFQKYLFDKNGKRIKPLGKKY